MKRLPLALLLILSVGLSLYGLDFGLPNRNHAYPYNPDEWTPMQALRAMEPSQLDFNPHYFIGPTLPIYMWGATFGAAHLAGWLSITGGERFYFDHPEHLARMLYAGRLWSVLFGALIVWAVYLLARRLGLSRGTALLAAFLAAIHPSDVVHNHFMKVNPMVTFLILAALLAMDHWVRRGGRKGLLLTGMFTGAALSTKYSAAMLLPLIAIAAVFRWAALSRERTGEAFGLSFQRREFGRAFRETFGVYVTALVVFLAGTPYLVLDFPEFWKEVEPYARLVFARKESEPSTPLLEALKHCLTIHLHAQTPLLLLAAAGGLIAFVRRRNTLMLLVSGWIVLFGWTTIRAGYLATDSRFMPLFPITALLAAIGLAAMIRWNRTTGLAAALLVVITTGFWTATLLTRFTGVQPQEAASEWAIANIGPGESVFMQSKGIYWNPDFPLREFLQEDNPDSYPRTTTWRFIKGKTYADARPANPDVVFVTSQLPRAPIGAEWFSDPDYEIVAEFPGKVHLFGRRVPVWIDFYEVDIWVLRRKDR